MGCAALLFVSRLQLIAASIGAQRPLALVLDQSARRAHSEENSSYK